MATVIWSEESDTYLADMNQCCWRFAIIIPARPAFREHNSSEVGNLDYPARLTARLTVGLASAFGSFGGYNAAVRVRNDDNVLALIGQFLDEAPEEDGVVLQGGRLFGRIAAGRGGVVDEAFVAQGLDGILQRVVHAGMGKGAWDQQDGWFGRHIDRLL